MKTRFACFVLLLGLGGAVASAEELVANPGFELEGEEAAGAPSWRSDKSVYSLDRSVKRSGEVSLKYQNDDPQRYRLASQTVPLAPGRKYRYGVWVKTEDIAGQDFGATVCLEWSDKDGKWLGGSYPSGVKGTADWTRVEGIVRIPKEAGKVNLSCYVRKGMTGTAWFDDVAIERIIDPPMRSVLLSPNYRGRITAAGAKEAVVRVHLDVTDFDHMLDELNLGWRLLAEDGSVLDGRAGFTPSRTEGIPTDLLIPLPDLAAGSYALAVHLLDAKRKVLQETRHALQRMDDNFKATCAIDEHNRLLVEGKPFLPLGMYWGGIQEDDLRTYADSKFNCLMPYGSPKREQMDLAHSLGLKVIYSVKDFYAGSRHAPGFIKTEADEKPNVLGRVERFRDHPALLAWYLNDELPQSYLPRLEAHQQWVAQADPNHPTWVVLYQFREVGAYLNTFDVIGTDPYPIGRHPASEVAEWTAETRRQVEDARPLWQVPQVHNWINYRKDDAENAQYRTPTYDEMRSMAWQCLCEGATGLVFYSWFDLKRNPDVPFEQQWGELKRIVAEIDRFAPILLSVEDNPAVRVNVALGTPGKADGAESIALALETPAKPDEAPSWLHTLVRHHEGKTYVLAVNDGDGSGSVQFEVSVGRGFTTGQPNMTNDLLRVASIRDLTEDREINLSLGGFTDAFEPLSVHVYEIVCRRK